MTPTASRSLWLGFFLAGCLLVARFAFSPPQTMDYWFFLAKGKRTSQQGLQTLGGPNPFVFTAPKGSRFYDKEWLFEWSLWHLYQRAGHAGAVLAKGALVLLLWLLFFLIGRRLGAPPWLSLVIFALALGTVLVPRFSIRPHLVGYVFLLTLFFALLRPPTWATLLGVGAMFVAWGNIHGTFVMAGALLGSYGAWALLAPPLLQRWSPEQAERAKAWRRWWVLLPLLPLLLCINPYGWELWKVIWAFQKEISANPDPFVTPEWVAFQLAHPHGLALVVLLALTLITWTLPDNRKHTERLGWIAVVALLGFSNLRFVGLAFLLLGPLLAVQLHHIRSTLLRRTATTGLTLLAGFFLVQAWFGAPANALQPDLREQPDEVIDLLQKHPSLPGRIFTNIHVTGYLAHTLSSHYRTSYDAHPITPGFSAWSQAYKRATLNPQAWDAYCQKHRCNLILLDLQDQRSILLAAHLQDHKQWTPIRMTLRWVLYSRNDFAPSIFAPERFRVLTSFYSFRSALHSKASPAQRKAELQRLRRSPESASLADAIEAYRQLQTLHALPFSPPQRLTPPRKKQLQQTTALMKRAYQDAPWHPGVNLGLGLALSALDQPGAARHFKLATRWNPIWIQPRVALIRYWHRRNHPTRTRRAIQDLLRLGRRGHHAWQRLRPLLR